MKTCHKCELPKEESEFAKCSDNRDGLQFRCRQCSRDYSKNKWLNTSKEGRASIRERQRLTRLRSPNKYKETATKWRHKNNEKMRGYAKKTRLKNPDAKRISHKKWRLKNRGWYKAYVNNKYAKDPNFRIRSALKNRLNKALLRDGATKSARTLELLGCPIWHLKAHFDFLFRPGMTWANHGSVWHIDHIKPCAKFDLTDPEQQKDCFNWTNLQPLFAMENFIKSDTYHG